MLRWEAGKLLGFVGPLRELGKGLGPCHGSDGSHERAVIRGGAGSALGVKKSFWGQVGVGPEAWRMGRGGGVRG